MSKPSFRETLLLLLVLSITAWNILRLWTALAWHAVLTEFAGAEVFKVATISGAVWALAGIFIAWSILRRKGWAGKSLAAAAIAYSLWYWSARFIWQNPHPNWLFAVVVNLALFLFIALTIKSLSREAYEREIENPKTE